MAMLVRYILSATLARIADGGAAIGLLLLCVAEGGFDRPALVGGLLAAALTAPHLVAPWLAAWLDRAEDGRWLISGGMGAFGVLLAAATLALGRLPIGIVAVLVVLAGVCGPLLAAGLGSRLGLLVGPDEHRRRRAQSWDAVTYGVGGSLGPAVVAALASAASPRLALLALAAAAVLAGGVVLTLRPLGHDAEEREAAPTTAAVLQMLVTIGPLRRVTYATVTTAFVLGALIVVPVQLAPRLGLDAAAGAALVTAFGIGDLSGSLLLTLRPLRGEPEALTIRWVAAMALALVTAALAPTFPVALAAFFLVGAANAPFFVATLAARTSFAPPGGAARVFVGVAAVKVAANSGGTAVAGLTSGLDPRAVLLTGAVLVGGVAGAAWLERRLTRRPETAGLSA